MSLRATMSSSKAAVSAAMLGLACAVSAGAQSPGAAPAWNDNSLVAVQKNGGDPARGGDVKIEFYGHDAFKITSPAGLTVLTDPGGTIPRVSTQSGSSTSFRLFGWTLLCRPTRALITMRWDGRTR